MARGRFISLEGGEGVGKSTQLAALAEALRGRGLTVLVTREPGGSPGAEAIRKLLLEGDDARWNPRAEALLFAAARADHIERTIRPALERGAWVLSDRFLDSSRAYQGMGDLSDDDILTLHRIGSGGFLPDRTLILTLDQVDAEQRVRARDGDAGDRIGARSEAFHRSVAQAFANFAAREPERIRQIDAAGDAADVTARLLAGIVDMLP